MNKILRMAGVACLCVGCGLLGGWLYAQRGSGHLSWKKPDVKKTIHTFAYKIYARPHLSNGRFFLSKIVFKNDGDKPVRDFSISYSIPNYVPATTPETLATIPPGVTVIKLFYPQFSPAVARMTELNTATLETKLHWMEGSMPHDQVLSEDFQFRGVNEIEWTDIPEEDRLEQDMFVNADLVSAMVTPNDPVVAAYASEITAKLHGAVAGAGGGYETYELMRGIYEYMQETGMQYAGSKDDEEMIGNVRTSVQTIRLPRNAVQNNNALCIELALLWASVMDHMGIQPCIVMRPGHAYILAPKFYYTNGLPFTVECTAITPKSLGPPYDELRSVSFDLAVKMSQQDFAKYSQAGRLKIVDVMAVQEAGVTPPELPDVDIEKLKLVLAARRKRADPPVVYVQNRAPAAAPQSVVVSTPAPSPVVPAPMPETSSGELTAFALIQEGNRYVGEQCKDAIVQIRSEKSIATLTPNTWYLVYYDPDATFKASEVKFISGKKVAVTRPMRVLEPITGDSKTLDRSKFKLDSDKALSIAISQPAVRSLSLRASQFWLQHEGQLPVWRVRLWAAKLRNPNDTADIGDTYISTDDGSLVRSDLHVNSVD